MVSVKTDAKSLEITIPYGLTEISIRGKILRGEAGVYDRYLIALYDSEIKLSHMLEYMLHGQYRTEPFHGYSINHLLQGVPRDYSLQIGGKDCRLEIWYIGREQIEISNGSLRVAIKHTMSIVVFIGGTVAAYPAFEEGIILLNKRTQEIVEHGFPEAYRRAMMEHYKDSLRDVESEESRVGVMQSVEESLDRFDYSCKFNPIQTEDLIREIENKVLSTMLKEGVFTSICSSQGGSAVVGVKSSPDPPPARSPAGPRALPA